MTARMLQGGYLAVMQAASPLEFRGEVVRFAEELGFKTVSAMAVVDHAQSSSEFHSVDNAPHEFSQTFHDSDVWRLDPVMQHCKRAAVPIIWDQGTYVADGQGEMWEHQAGFGYQTGVALALHLPGGKHFSLGVERDRPLPKQPRAMTRIVAELQLFAVHAQDAAFRIFAPPAPKLADGPSLNWRR
jgi:hypothetical protein